MNINGIKIGEVGILLLFSAFFSASETALFSISRERLNLFEESKSRVRQLIYKLIADGKSTLIVILIGNLFVNIMITAVIHSLVHSFFLENQMILTMLTATSIILVFGEMLPKVIALRHNEKIALLFAPPLSFLKYLLSPLVNLFNNINNTFLIWFTLFLKKPSPFVTIDEMKSSIIGYKNKGAFSEEEQDIMIKILEKGKEPIRKSMIHRRFLLLMPETTLVEEAIRKIKDIPLGCIFVYNKLNTAEVKGKVDFSLLTYTEKTKMLGEIMEPLFCLPENLSRGDALRLMFEKKIEGVGVIDEYGSFCGYFTLISGLKIMLSSFEIKSDTEEKIKEEELYKKRINTKIVNGDTDVDLIKKWLPPSLERISKDYRTIGGVLTNYLGFIPKEGDKFEIDDWIFYILSATEVKIEKIIIKKKEVL